RVVGFRVDEQLAAEQVLPGSGSDHLHRQVVLFGRADMHMGYEVILGIVEGYNAVPQGIELVGRERTVDGAPGNLVLGARLFNDIAISRGTTSTVTGADNQRTIGGQFTLAAAKGFFDQLRSTNGGVHGIVGLRHVSLSASAEP